MRKLLSILAVVALAIPASGQILILKAGADGVVFEPATVIFPALRLSGTLVPNANDGAALGTTTLGFADLFLATGGTVHFANTDWVATHSTGILTVGTGDLRVTTVGTNTASVVTVGGTQTLTAKTLTSPTINTPVIASPEINEALTTYSGDGAITVTSHVAFLTKAGSAAAMTLAAPGAGGIGKILKITTGSDFAHVVTFTGATLWDGTATANSTWTAAAVQGSSITVVGVTSTKWNVLSFNLGTIAP